MRPERGVTLIELVVTMVVVAIIVTAVSFFLTPLRQSTDVAMRAESERHRRQRAAARRARREARAAEQRARSPASGGASFVEFLAVRDAGRYRADTAEASPPPPLPEQDDAALGSPDNDQLSFDTPRATRCFKSIGQMADAATIAVNSDLLVLNNLGAGVRGPGRL